MKKFVAMLFLLAISLPAVAQVRLSVRDQQRFDSYFSRWQQYKAVNDSGQIISMERRMLDVYAHYGISAETPFWRVATNAQPERPRWRERMSHEEREHFDHLYERWIDARDRRDHFEMERIGHHMREIMERNGIPQEVRFEELVR